MDKENQMNDQDQIMASLVARALADEEFKQRLLAKPREVFTEVGLDIPAGVEPVVVENTKNKFYMVLPAADSGEVAGGGYIQRPGPGSGAGRRPAVGGPIRPGPRAF